jgi:DNA-binding MarR family transcriptional regulator
MQPHSDELHRGDLHRGETHLVALLHQAADRVSAELGRRLEEAGLGDIRAAHGCVFGHIRPEGSRLTDLAEKAGLTKQTVGEVATELERLGYLERVPDPTDGRAKILHLTERGREAQDTGFGIIDEIEAEWAERFGDERMAVLRAVLEEVVGVSSPEAAVA